MWLFPVLSIAHRDRRSWRSWCRCCVQGGDNRSALMLSLLSWAVVLVLYFANKWFI